MSEETRLVVQQDPSIGYFVADITLGPVTTPAIIDTGSRSTVIPSIFFEMVAPDFMQFLEEKGKAFPLIGVGGVSTPAYMCVFPEVAIGPFTVKDVQVSVLIGHSIPILGLQALEQLKLVMEKGILTITQEQREEQEGDGVPPEPAEECQKVELTGSVQADAGG